MDPELLRCAIASLHADIQAEYGMDPLSRTFIFSRKFAAARNRVEVLGDSARRTVLSVLLHEAMTDEARAEIFPGRFDLGNRLIADDRECSYSGLARELDRESKNVRKVDPSEAFETIKNRISNFIGRKLDLRSRPDKSTVLKVVKLLYWLTRERKGKFFPLLESPEEVGRAGLEFREAYPNSKNEESTWLVGDLKEYLGAELAEDRLCEIRGIFANLPPLVDRTLQHVEREIVAAGRNQYAFVVSTYEEVVQRAKCFDFNQPRLESLPLDEELYIYISSLEFRHYAQTDPSLAKVADPQIDIRPIADALRRLAQRINPGDAERVREHSRLILLKNFDDFANGWGKDIRAMMAQAMCITIDERTYAESITHAKNLLARVYVFDGNRGFDVDGVELSPWEAVAALCSTYYESQNRTSHEPYWYGQKTPPGSLWESLNMPLSADVLEEHSQIWRHRLRWFRMAIGGHLELHRQKMALRAVLIDKVADIARMNDTELIKRGLGELGNHVDRSCSEAITSGR